MNLCLSCGFCCDGTLFDRVPLQAVELAQLGRSLNVSAGTAHARQPCAALEGTACRVYENRPLTCRRFRCLLLEAHEAGEVTLPAAISIVDETRAMRRLLAEALETDELLAMQAARTQRASLTEPARTALDRLEQRLRFQFHRSAV